VGFEEWQKIYRIRRSVELDKGTHNHAIGSCCHSALGNGPNHLSTIVGAFIETATKVATATRDVPNSK